MFGIEDPGVWMAYLLCFAATIVCIGHGIRHWNRADDEIGDQDRKWAKQEREVEDDL